MVTKRTQFEDWYGNCPYCNSEDLRDAGETKRKESIVQCIDCGKIMLEKDIPKIRKELNEREKEI